MSKCSCYYLEPSVRYTFHPITGEPIKHEYMKSVCYGTKEREQCSCDGDMRLCDFYSEVRENAFKSMNGEYGKWISVEDKLPKKNTQYLLCVKSLTSNDQWVELGVYNENRNITHWMPLPTLPVQGDIDDE